ncbi:MAG: hypothetical protein LQ351_005678 [Letrouitia transgressa]|nr:MAG: hypothetical protein LQ351_005678 [Letrouitia transgressa]
MRLSNHSTVPVYTVSGSSTARPLPEWLARKKRRSLKTDPEYASRIELLQDFQFEEASQCIRVSEDGQWVMSTGTYKPQIHTHYLPHLSLSFARHTASLNTKFLLLSSDYSKSLHLQNDRSMELHTPLGCHYTTRIPRYGRDLKYDRRCAEALIPAAGMNENGSGEVFRLNLELGRYMKAYEVNVAGDGLLSAPDSALQSGISTGTVNVAAVAEVSHNLLAFGTSIGTIEFWDSRSRNKVGLLRQPVQADLINGKQEVTALEFDGSGLGLAAGTSAGMVNLYDLRSPSPKLRKEQGYGYPIQNLIFLNSTSSGGPASEPRILSADKRVIKIWNPNDGSPWTSVEPAVDINCVAWCKDSGMLLTANEGKQQHSFFIPQLGPAPKWCSFLDNLVEEMAEDPNDPNAFTNQKAGEVYDNYKFLTTPQLQTLNLSHLIGTTSLLKPYMHGYFVAQRLYEEAKLIADPFVWEDERNKRVKERINSERESRIRGNKKVIAKVNKRLAEKIIEKARKNERKIAQRVLEKGGDDDALQDVQDENAATQKEPGGLPTDPRFAKLFEDEDFAIDETSREFQLLNPSTKTAVERSLIDGGFRKLNKEEEALDTMASSNYDSSSSDTSLSEDKPTPQNKDSGRISSPSYKRSGHRGQRPQIRVLSSPVSRAVGDRSFGSRMNSTKTRKRSSTSTLAGEREVSFAPQRKKKADYAQKPVKRRDQGRRSASGNTFRYM